MKLHPNKLAYANWSTLIVLSNFVAQWPPHVAISRGKVFKVVGSLSGKVRWGPAWAKVLFDF